MKCADCFEEATMYAVAQFETDPDEFPNRYVTVEANLCSDCYGSHGCEIIDDYPNPNPSFGE